MPINARCIIISSILFAFHAWSQVQPKLLRLSLEDAIDRALHQGVQSTINNRLLEIGRLQHKVYVSGLLPELGLNGNLPGYTNQITPVIQPDGTIKFTGVRQGLASVGLALRQVIPYTGGLLSISSNINRFSRYNSAGEFVNWQSQPFLISISQPVFAFNQGRLDGRIAKLNLELSSRSFVENRENICLELVQVFFGTLLARQRVILNEQANRMADTLYLFADTKFKLGRMEEEELLQIRLRTITTRNELAQARTALSISLNKLRALLSINNGLEIEPVYNKELPVFEVGMEEAVQHLQHNNPMAVQMKIEQMQQTAVHERAVRARLPDLTLNASYGYNQSALALNDAYKNPVRQQAITVGFYMPLVSSGAAAAACKIAKYELENQLSRQEIRMQITSQEISSRIIEMNQAREVIASARSVQYILTRRYELALAKFLAGKIPYSEVLLAQNDNQAATLNYLTSLQDFWTAYYSLRAITLYDFETGKPLVHVK